MILDEVNVMAWAPMCLKYIANGDTDAFVSRDAQSLC